MSTVFFLLLILAISGAACVVYYFSTRSVARRDSRRLAHALSTTQAVFAAVDEVPPGLIGRELRKALVLITNHHLTVLAELQPRHPHLAYLKARVDRLNRIPAGYERNQIRSISDRKGATIALESLSDIIKIAAKQKVLASKQADLAAAAASFAAQQVAIETARQAAKDAENVRAYKQALNFAYQAQALCAKLPPLMGKALTESLTADVERLETRVGART